MKKATYFAVFEPTASGYSVYFPDLPGCITIGENLEEAYKMAREALGLHLWGMEKDNEEIPIATLPPYVGIDASDFVMPIEIFPDLFKNEIESKAVKKTLTIPYWLNELAEKNQINFSQILQNALKEYLQIAK
jgi:predicted RNase H-like HicB family nuclease